MTNPTLMSAIAAERQRDMLAAAEQARLARAATTPAPRARPGRRWGLFGRRAATARPVAGPAFGDA